VGDGIAEIGHEAIAHILRIVSFVLSDDAFCDFMEIIDRVTRLFQVEMTSEHAGVDHVAAQQGHLSPVRSHSGSDLGLRESITGWDTRVGDEIVKLRSYDGAAAIAKLVGGRNLSPALRALQRKRRTAATAEPGAFPIVEAAQGTFHKLFSTPRFTSRRGNLLRAFGKAEQDHSSSYADLFRKARA
jgi:hypothetical protein